MSIITTYLKVHLTKSLFLLATFCTFLFTGCNKNIAVNPMAGNSKNIVMHYQDISNTINFFSHNYPYTVASIESYYQATLIPKGNNLYLLSKQSEVKSIELTTVEKGQILILNLHNKLCLTNDDLYQIKDSYTLVLDPVSPSFSRMLDEKNKVGSLHLSYEFADSDICLTRFIFNTITPFDKSSYEN